MPERTIAIASSCAGSTARRSDPPQRNWPQRNWRNGANHDPLTADRGGRQANPFPAPTGGEAGQMAIDPAGCAGGVLEIDLAGIVANWRRLSRLVAPAALRRGGQGRRLWARRRGGGAARWPPPAAGGFSSPPSTREWRCARRWPRAGDRRVQRPAAGLGGRVRGAPARPGAQRSGPDRRMGRASRRSGGRCRRCSMSTPEWLGSA